MKYGIVLIEKAVADGLTKEEINRLLDLVDSNEVYPIEIEGDDSSAMGFVSPKAGYKINYDYENSGLNDFVRLILRSEDKISNDNKYQFRGIDIYLEVC